MHKPIAQRRFLDSTYGQIGGLHCFALGSLARGSKLFSRLAVQTLGICLLGAGLGNCFLVGLAHFSHRRGLTRWRLAKAVPKPIVRGKSVALTRAMRFSMIGILIRRQPKPYP